MAQHRSGPIRSDAAREAILNATASLFEEAGYDRFTIEGVAARAGVGKQTVYRWWPSKGALISECLLEGLILHDTLAPPNTGDMRADFLAWIDSLFRLLEQPRGQDLLRSLVAAAAEFAEVGRRLGQALTDNGEFAQRLQDAAGVEAHSMDLPLPELGEAVIGTIIWHALTRQPLEPDGARRLYDVLLAGVATEPDQSSTGQ